jgi:cyclomaltodextrinase
MKGLLHRQMLLLFVIRAASALNPDGITHDPMEIFYVNQQVGEIKLRVSKQNITQAFLVVGTRRMQMNVGYRDANFDYYVANLTPFDSTLAYGFILRDGTDSLRLPAEGSFHAHAARLQIPEWSAGSIVYLINPDGFFNGDINNDPADKNEWGNKPNDWLPYGGDLEGIAQKMDYISSLGPDVILLSPIFAANSNHKMNPRDYASVDPAYGDTIDLKRLIAAAHGAGKKIVLNVVFTHTGTDFPAFADIVTNGRSSRYTDWYRIRSMPTDSSGFIYNSWRSDERFPLLNLHNQTLQSYLIGFIDYWTHFGLDGFYVGESEDIDQGFMKALYDHLKSKHPELFIITSDYHVRELPNNDGCLDRQFTRAMLAYFVNNDISTAAFDSIIHNMLFFEPAQLNCTRMNGFYDYSKRIGMLVNAKLCKVMYAFVFTFCGSPLLLYGDEIGMSDCTSLNWGSFDWNKDQEDVDLLRTIRSLVRIRKENPQIRDRYFFTLYIDDIKKVYAYDRGGIIVALNSGTGQSFVELPAWDGTYVDLMDGTKYTAFEQKLRFSIDPISFRILKREI